MAELKYDVVVTLDLTASGGFISLSPPMPYSDLAFDLGSGPHFFKCKGCRRLGSIELQEVVGSMRQTAARLRFLTFKSHRYKIVSYSARQEWEAVCATGEVVPVYYGTDNLFRGSNATGGEVAIAARFEIVQRND